MCNGLGYNKRSNKVGRSGDHKWLANVNSNFCCSHLNAGGSV